MRTRTHNHEFNSNGSCQERRQHNQYEEHHDSEEISDESDSSLYNEFRVENRYKIGQSRGVVEDEANFDYDPNPEPPERCWEKFHEALRNSTYCNSAPEPEQFILLRYQQLMDSARDAFNETKIPLVTTLPIPHPDFIFNSARGLREAFGNTLEPRKSLVEYGRLSLADLNGDWEENKTRTRDSLVINETINDFDEDLEGSDTRESFATSQTQSLPPTTTPSFFIHKVSGIREPYLNTFEPRKSLLEYGRLSLKDLKGNWDEIGMMKSFATEEHINSNDVSIEEVPESSIQKPNVIVIQEHRQSRTRETLLKCEEVSANVTVGCSTTQPLIGNEESKHDEIIKTKEPIKSLKPDVSSTLSKSSYTIEPIRGNGLSKLGITKTTNKPSVEIPKSNVRSAHPKASSFNSTTSITQPVIRNKESKTDQTNNNTTELSVEISKTNLSSPHPRGPISKFSITTESLICNGNEESKNYETIKTKTSRKIPKPNLSSKLSKSNGTIEPIICNRVSTLNINKTTDKLSLEISKSNIKATFPKSSTFKSSSKIRSVKLKKVPKIEKTKNNTTEQSKAVSKTNVSPPQQPKAAITKSSIITQSLVCNCNEESKIDETIKTKGSIKIRKPEFSSTISKSNGTIEPIICNRVPKQGITKITDKPSVEIPKSNVRLANLKASTFKSITQPVIWNKEYKIKRIKNNTSELTVEVAKTNVSSSHPKAATSKSSYTTKSRTCIDNEESKNFTFVPSVAALNGLFQMCSVKALGYSGEYETSPEKIKGKGSLSKSDKPNKAVDKVEETVKTAEVKVKQKIDGKVEKVEENFGEETEEKVKKNVEDLVQFRKILTPCIFVEEESILPDLPNIEEDQEPSSDEQKLQISTSDLLDLFDEDSKTESQIIAPESRGIAEVELVATVVVRPLALSGNPSSSNSLAQDDKPCQANILNTPKSFEKSKKGLCKMMRALKVRSSKSVENGSLAKRVEVITNLTVSTSSVSTLQAEIFDSTSADALSVSTSDKTPLEVNPDKIGKGSPSKLDYFLDAMNVFSLPKITTAATSKSANTLLTLREPSTSFAEGECEELVPVVNNVDLKTKNTRTAKKNKSLESNTIPTSASPSESSTTKSIFKYLFGRKFE